jgi:hypothetical protein
MEIFFIKKNNSFNNGYNSTLGGEGGDTISMKSKEEKKKLSNSILNSEKYKKGLKKRKHGMSKQVIRKNDGKIWSTIKECANEIGITKEMVRYNIIKGKTINYETYFFK